MVVHDDHTLHFRPMKSSAAGIFFRRAGLSPVQGAGSASGGAAAQGGSDRLSMP